MSDLKDFPLPITADRIGTTQATYAIIGPITLFFSYQTLIAANFEPSSPDVKRQYLRRPNHWGPTTGKHFGQLDCKHYPVTAATTERESALELRRFVTDALFQLGVDHLHAMLAHENTPANP